MKITRDVITDLLPAYEANESSADSRALVEEYLAQDAELAALVRKGREAVKELRANGEVPALAEVAALSTARREIRRRTTYLSLAILFTVWPLSFSLSDGGVSFFFRQLPVVGCVFWVLAAGFWSAYARQRRRLQATEL